MAGFAKKTDIEKYVKINDILIAINGICFGAKLVNHSLEEWKNRLLKVTNPMIITFFRLKSNGDLLLNPQRVFLS